MFRYLITLLTAAVLIVTPSEAANNRQLAQKREPTRTLEKPVSISIVTGPRTGTYIAIGNDIAHVAEEEQVKVEVKDSDGSIDNIKRINSNENASLGIVQSDVLGFLSRSRNPDSMKMAGNLRMVLPLYKEEVHVLARKEIASFADLKGKVIAIGEEGSGHMLTAVNLLSMMDIKAKDLLRLSPPEGVAAVLKGNADAMIFVGGKPVKLFKNLEQLAAPENEKFTPMLDQVHFLPLNAPRMLEEYQLAVITPEDYGFMPDPIPTVAVTAVLVTFDFSKNPERCNAIARVAEAVRGHLSDLVKEGHPKWGEVKLDAELGYWKKDVCVWPNQRAEAPANLGEDLMQLIARE